MRIINIIILIWCVVGLCEYLKKNKINNDVKPFPFGPFALIVSLLMSLFETLDWSSPFKRRK